MRICENCKIEHDGNYGTGRFCGSKCARSFSTKIKREEINKKVSKTLKGFRTIPGGKIKLCDYDCGDEAKFQLNNGKWCCSDSYNKCIKIREKNSKQLKKLYSTGKKQKAPLSKEHYTKGQETYRKRLKEYYDTLPFEEKPLREKQRIILSEQDGKCLICNINEWNNKPLKLHLDHIDGNNTNNKRENLRYICPNCHSQTDTYCGSNIKKNNIPEKKIVEALLTSKNISQALQKCNLVPKGKNYFRFKEVCTKYSIF